MRKLFLGFAIMLCLISTAVAVTELWIKNYTGTDFGQAQGVAVDSHNNVIVTGVSENAAGTGNNDYNDYLTIKYDENGTVLWIKDYTSTSNDMANGVAIDSLNNVIVTGWSANAAGTGNIDYLTIKYDENGNVLWMRNYTGTGADLANGVAVDSHNNVIVTGKSDNAAGSETFEDYLTIKYDENGTVLWMKNYTGTRGDEAQGVAVDSHNNVIVTGYSENVAGPGGFNYLTIKYDENGTVLWTKYYTSSTGVDMAHGVAIDSLNNIIVAGWSVNAAGTGDNDYLTIKYDENGNVLWMRNYTGTGADLANGVAVDYSNNIIVTGYSDTSVGRSDYYCLTIKYNENGTVLWTKNYTGRGNREAYGVAVDSLNNIIITGMSANVALGKNGYFTIKYEPGALPTGGGAAPELPLAALAVIGAAMAIGAFLILRRS
jgi:uncharacterized delta-60 repeat protein